MNGNPDSLASAAPDRGPRVRAASDVEAFTEAEPRVKRIADILRG
jgi:hypothetical protein